MNQMMQAQASAEPCWNTPLTHERVRWLGWLLIETGTLIAALICAHALWEFWVHLYGGAGLGLLDTSSLLTLELVCLPLGSGLMLLALAVGIRKYGYLAYTAGQMAVDERAILAQR